MRITPAKLAPFAVHGGFQIRWVWSSYDGRLEAWDEESSPSHDPRIYPNHAAAEDAIKLMRARAL